MTRTTSNINELYLTMEHVSVTRKPNKRNHFFVCRYEMDEDLVDLVVLRNKFPWMKDKIVLWHTEYYCEPFVTSHHNLYIKVTPQEKTLLELNR